MSIMKKSVKLFVVILTAAILLGSCDLIKTGGTIIVENKLDYSNYVIIVKGEKFDDAVKDLLDNKGTLINKDGKKSFSFDEDGVYTVTALYPAAGPLAPVTLAGGITLTVTITPKND